MEILLAIANIFGMVFFTVVVYITLRDTHEDNRMARQIRNYEVLKSEESNN
jgi:hypothetical protein